MNPLASEIWIYILLAYGLVSITLWIVARFSPIEWKITRPPTCDNYFADQIRRKRLQLECKCDGDDDDDDNKKQNTEEINVNTKYHLNEDAETCSNDDDYAENVIASHRHRKNIVKHKMNKRFYPSKDNAKHLICNEEDDCYFPRYIDNDESIDCNDTTLMLTHVDHKHDDHAMQTDLNSTICIDNNHKKSNKNVINSCDMNGCIHKVQLSHDTNEYNSFDSYFDTHNCDYVDCDGFQETELLCTENNFTLTNSFWFSIGTLMQQGSDLNPKVFFLF